ncbi:hypothetical protein DERF_000874 [Dermatophagoides farinae]|uniref:Uncharacterized protein n=1 Tax=Dermatophagoides farinae TaxID=6954 RepID=A0A922I9R4_DERFA|nr:hypothetical protein DERF_000874 [Dermatophagoides farinae]
MMLLCSVFGIQLVTFLFDHLGCVLCCVIIIYNNEIEIEIELLLDVFNTEVLIKNKMIPEKQKEDISHK